MDDPLNNLILALGVVGGLVFYGRFIVQWIASERKKRSAMPIVFWYMSAVGSVMLLTYGILDRSLLGTLGQNINVIIYGRNIAHIWRDEDRLTPTTSRILHLAMGIIAIIGLIAVVQLSLREWQVQSDKSPLESQTAWAWLILGLVGQGLFAARFILQWIVTERAKRSIIPNAFWFLSFFAALFQCAAFVQREKWVFAIGMALTVFIYSRNIWFIYRGQPSTTEQG
ncbi:MAG: lipid-A-disaccharide synthase N-terminal domain-containing protein [Candidatus Hydrogenedentota bacterium]